jgi:peptide/nickel transport system permease protein
MGRADARHERHPGFALESTVDVIVDNKVLKSRRRPSTAGRLRKEHAHGPVELEDPHCHTLTGQAARQPGGRVKAYILRRLLGLVPILIGISLLVFVLMRMLPGDVAQMLLMGDADKASGVSNDAVNALRLKLGLDLPLYQQYLHWIGGLLRLDAGNSLWSGQPVFAEIAERLPLTIELALLALVIGAGLAIPVGIFSALRQDSWADYVFRSITIAGLAIPGFWMATLLILALTVWFQWAPPLGYVRLTEDPLANLQQLIWPALIIGIHNAAIVARMTRSTLLEVMREDYIRTARAKGLGLRAVLTVHALRNAMLPVLTLLAIELAGLLNGTVIMEVIFTLPGVGRYLVDAILHRDYPVVQAIVVIMAVVYVVLNLVVDLLYGLLDPRIRYN